MLKSAGTEEFAVNSDVLKHQQAHTDWGGEQYYHGPLVHVQSFQSSQDPSLHSYS